MEDEPNHGAAGCPDDAAIAGFVEGRLPAAQAHALEEHVRGCAACRELVRFARGSGHDPGSSTVPAEDRLSPSEGRQLLDALRADQDTLAPADADEANRDPFAVGAVISGYRLRRRVGQGGMGVVYEADDLRLDRRVALKFVSPRFAAEHQVSARLRREARAIAALQHPNLGVVFDVGEHRGLPFIVMAFHDGVTLSQALEKGPLPRADALALLTQIAAGVACAHAAGIVHRDIKPSNVMLGEGGEVKVLDFGLAKLIGNPDVTATVEGELLGTVAYMAPEQLRREEVDARADVWSIGISAVEMLAGKRPFVGSASVQIAHAVLHDEPLLPRKLPHDLEAVLLKCLEKERDRRYRDAGELLADLRRLGAGEPVTARRPHWLERLARRTRRDPRRLVVAAAAAVIVMAAVGAVRSRDGAGVCRGGPSKIASIWNDERRAALHRAFTATGKPFAEAMFGLAARGIDDAAQAWSAMYGDACEATRLRGEQSEEVLQLRMECLEERRQGLHALVDVFVHADADVVQRADQVLQGVASLEQCRNSQELRQIVRPPANADARARVADLRARLADATARDLAGRYAEAQKLSDTIVADARQLGYAPVLAEALRLRGTVEDRLGHYDAAIAMLLAATVQAEAGHDDRAKAQALLRLVYECGYRLTRYEEAHAYGQLAHAALARLGADAAVELLLAEQEANVLGQEGRNDEALTILKDVLARGEKLHGSESAAVGRTLINMGTTRLAQGDVVQARADYRRAIAIWETRYGPRHPYAATAWHNLATTLMTKNATRAELEEAVQAEEKALAIRQAVFGPDHDAVAVVLNGLAGAYRGLGDAQRAAKLDERALAIDLRALGAEHQHVASIELDLGACLLQLQRFDDALAHMQRGLAVRERQLGREHAAVAQALVHVAEVQLARRAAVEALPLLERALLILQKDPKSELLPNARFLLARALWETRGDRGRARALALQARDAYTPRAEVDAWLARHD